jgi:hypothetical protein
MLPQLAFLFDLLSCTDELNPPFPYMAIFYFLTWKRWKNETIVNR